jgi:hypothetical protein
MAASGSNCLKCFEREIMNEIEINYQKTKALAKEFVEAIVEKISSEVEDELDLKSTVLARLMSESKTGIFTSF